MTDRYESRASTHADDCWSWGPGHYKCAVAKIERLHEQLRRETERRWEGNLRAAQEYVDDMRDVLKEAVRVCKDLDDEALAKEGRLACGSECAAAIADLAARMNVPFEGEQQ